MAGPNLIPTIEGRVRSVWETFFAEIVKMGGDARPKQAADIFTAAPGDNGIEVTVKPVSFLLKEKASHTGKSIFVTVAGTLIFSKESTRQDLRAQGFATRVGYFREVGNKRLKHVYGVHYDYDDKLPAHPIYHCQMASMADHVQHINSSHNRMFNAIDDEDDLVKGLLGNVRIPTAQMDPFSVFLQLLGDHLVSEVNNDGRSAFVRAQNAVAAIRSRRDPNCRLDAVVSNQCFRSNHWYRDDDHPAKGA